MGRRPLTLDPFNYTQKKEYHIISSAVLEEYFESVPRDALKEGLIFIKGLKVIETNLCELDNLRLA